MVLWTSSVWNFCSNVHLNLCKLNPFQLQEVSLLELSPRSPWHLICPLQKWEWQRCNCLISWGHRTASIECSPLSLWKITPHFPSSVTNPTTLVWACFLQPSCRWKWDLFHPKKTANGGSHGPTCCVVVLIEQDLYLKLPLSNKPYIGCKGWRQTIDSFPEPALWHRDSGWQVSLWVSYPYWQPMLHLMGHGLSLSSLRLRWTCGRRWASEPGPLLTAQCSHHHTREGTGAHYCSFILLYITSPLNISSGEITFKPWRGKKKKRKLAFLL